MKRVMIDWLRCWGALTLALSLGLALKVTLLVLEVVPFNADEAVVALMARHILQGQRPVFFYGQAYLGSLDAWLIAGAFALAGQAVWVMRAVQSALYLGVIATTFWLGLRVYANRWIAGVAAVLLAVPTVLVSLYTTATIGGYGETLLIGNLLLVVTLGMNEPTARRGWLLAFGWGLLAGLGWWTFPLIGVYLVPCVVYVLFVHHWPIRLAAGRWWLVALVGLCIGAAPWLGYMLSNGFAALSETGGAAIAGVSATHPLVAIAEHTFSFLLFGLTVIFGLRTPWYSPHFWLALPLAPLALMVFSALIAFIVRRAASLRTPADWRRGLLIGVCLTNTLAFIFTPFGADPSGRYFLPMTTPLALLLAEMLFDLRAHYPKLAYALVAGTLVFNGWGTLQSVRAFPPGFTTQFDAVAQIDQRDLPAVMAFLRAHGEMRGYSNYWVEFPLAFLSNEELIYEARLPYHQDFRYTSRDNRYPAYRQAVAVSDRVAYITTKHLPLDEKIRAGLRTLEVSFQETQIGDYHIFYALGRKVLPEELGLEAECCEP